MRRENREPVDKGGRIALFTITSKLDKQSPLLHILKTTGPTSRSGWADNPRIEELRAAWVDAPDLPTWRRIAAEMGACRV